MRPGAGQGGHPGQAVEGTGGDQDGHLDHRTQRTRLPRRCYQKGAREKEGRPGGGGKDR